jgi:hypothetical protein
MKIAQPRIVESLPGYAIEISGDLFRAAQMTVIIDDVTSALAVIIQLGAAPVAPSGLATGFQIVAVNANFLAALRIRSTWYAARISANSYRRSSYAAQVAVIVDDLSMTFPVIIQAGVTPVAISGFAARFQIIAMAPDVFAALRIKRTGRHAGITARISSNVAARSTTKIAILIGNVAAALLIIVKLGFVPVSIRGLATGFQIVSMGMNVLAGLRIRAVWHTRLQSCLITASNVSAAQCAVIIHNVIATAAIVAQQRGFPSSIRILAIRGKNFSPHINVFTRRLIRARWN